jgi:hypothetical protein
VKNNEHDDKDVKKKDESNSEIDVEKFKKTI